jgi:hypothetical protein
MKTYLRLRYLAASFLWWEMFQTKFVEKIKTHILCSVTCSRKAFRLWDNVEKYGRSRQATDDNTIRRMRFACCITKATTHRMCNTYCFSTTKMVTRTRLSVELYLHCLCCFYVYCSTYNSACQNPVTNDFHHIWLRIWRRYVRGGGGGGGQEVRPSWAANRAAKLTFFIKEFIFCNQYIWNRWVGRKGIQ